MIRKMESNEVLNSLLAFDQLQIIQRKDMFNFSLDTVLLANFCSITKDIKKIIDFGTNNAAIPLFLSKRTKQEIIGIEIQAEACEIARKNVILNHLEDQITIIHQDIKEYVKQASKAHLVLCNPPFFKVNQQSHLNESQYLQIARHEIKINLKEIVESASRILENKGKFAIVHRPDRLVDLLHYMENNHISPKRLRFVYPKENKESNILLLEGIKNGNSGLKIEPPLYAHNKDGSYHDEVLKMFGVDNNENTKEL